MYTQQLVFVAAALSTPLLSSANCMYGTSLFPRSEGAATVEVSKFGYTGLQGPLNWAALAAENSACATSKVQSPINIDSTVQLAAEVPKVVIADVEAAEFENLGTTVEVIVNGTTTFGGTEFSLKQFHFHTPSEHRVAEEYFPLEVHMVHEAADGSGAIAVIALTFQLSDDGTTTTELLTAVTENLAKIATPGTVTETGPLKFAEVINHVQTTPLFQYAGSLTTPPCAEGLTFLVTQKPLPLSVKTFNEIKSVVKFNSRYTQNSLNQNNLLAVGAAALAGAVAGEAAGNGTAAGNATEVAKPKPSGGAAVATSVKASATSKTAAGTYIPPHNHNLSLGTPN
ncbi:carbonic anhydrase [Choiromyces venosus 120613-1]|uniref:Carbonic anhydrase n=1 Tax=Choiromyces venosus 120613-1 TaxID=1336337 RepID=A0A3N4JTP9_9PEZI|nr:carbonic anhydrase [Choiromyces venosus 120613-1]